MEENEINNEYLTLQDSFIYVNLEVYANRQPVLYKHLNGIKDIIQPDEPHKFIHLIKDISNEQDIFKKMVMIETTPNYTIPDDTFIMFNKADRVSLACQIRYSLDICDAAFKTVRLGDVLMRINGSGACYKVMYLKNMPEPGIYLVRDSAEKEIIKITDRNTIRWNFLITQSHNL